MDQQIRRRRLFALLAALAILLLLHLISSTLPGLPHMQGVLLLVVVVAAYLGGIEVALFAAAVVFAYAAVFWSIPGQAFSYADQDRVRLFVLTLASPTAAFLIAYLRKQSEQRLADLQADIAQRIQTEAALKHTEAANAELLRRMDRVLKYSLDVICTLDARGRFVMVSAACERVWGYHADELIGNALIDLVYLDDRPATSGMAAAAMQGHAAFDFQNRVLRKDEKPAYMLWSAQWSEQDQLLFAVAHDLTAQRQLEEERAQSQQIIKSLRGLLPVCSWCNKIRNEHGGWDRLENYIEAHSEAQFSHSLCPQCLEQRYPEDSDAT